MAKSYYKEIDGKKYDAGIMDAAAQAVEGNGDGRISKTDAEKLLLQVKDGNKYTDIEKHTVALLREKFKWTDAADEWFRGEIRKWAAERGAKASGGGGGKVDLAIVKSLRQRTGAGIGDCKKALVEAEGDEEKAVELIQKKGLAKVAKKAGAIAAEGVGLEAEHVEPVHGPVLRMDLMRLDSRHVRNLLGQQIAEARPP